MIDVNKDSSRHLLLLYYNSCTEGLQDWFYLCRCHTNWLILFFIAFTFRPSFVSSSFSVSFISFLLSFSFFQRARDTL